MADALTAEAVKGIVSDAIREHEKREGEFARQTRVEVLEIVSALRNDLQGISTKLGDLADLRGEQKATRDLAERVGREASKLEERVRLVELASANQGQTTRRFEGVLDKLMWAGIAAIAGGAGAMQFFNG